MHRLTAFEFVPFSDAPQLVRLKRGDEIVAQFTVHLFLGWHQVDSPIVFDRFEDLTIEGEGVGRPYWDRELPPWIHGFDPCAEQIRVLQIRRAALEMQARGGSLLGMGVS